jgi:hypothetical protein
MKGDHCESVAVSWREEGNQLYKSAMSNAGLKAFNLRRALVQYQKSLSASVTPDDYASVYKNLAMTSLRLTPFEETADSTVFQFSQAAQFFKEAREAGNHCKGKVWLSSLKVAYESSTDEFMEFSKTIQISVRVRQLAKYSRLLVKDEVYAKLCMYILELHFNHSVGLLETQAFIKALSSLHECGFYLKEAHRYGEGMYAEECEDFDSRVYLHFCICESRQAISHGDETLKTLKRLGSEITSIHEDLIFSCIDFYKQAALLTREKFLECEAVACSRLGVIFHTILKNRKKGEEYYSRCLHLANSLKPRDLTTSNWYKDAFKGLDEIQQENLAEENRVSEAKAAFRVAFSVQLTELKTKHKQGTDSLLEHIYSKHPPKAFPEYVLPAISADNMKSLVRSALLHFHSDKQTKYEKDWRFMSEEIMLCLTEKYEILKS